MAHRKQDGGAQGVQLSLIVTPMLDMSFQLLSFFIMIYSPSALEGHLAGKLAAPPKDSAVKANNPANLDPEAQSDTDPDLTESLIVRVEAVPDPKAANEDDKKENFGDRK